MRIVGRVSSNGEFHEKEEIEEILTHYGRREEAGSRNQGIPRKRRNQRYTVICPKNRETSKR